MAPVDAAIHTDEPAWRERAVSRSVNAARSRAEQRVQRFLEAAFELIDEKGTTEFTIQEVIDRSKQSLRSFYEYFDSKDELVLALFEETIRDAAADIRRAVDAESDPLERLRAGAIRLHEWCDPGEAPRKRGAHHRRAISEMSLRLAGEHPERALAALGPVSHLLLELIDAAARSGCAPRRRHTAHRRSRPADDPLQLVRQPPRGEPEAATHRRGDLAVLPPRPRRLTTDHTTGGLTLRTVVVGASSGLGRSIGVGLARRGAQVALLARRRAHLEEAAKEAGPSTVAIECDVTDEASCRSAIAEAATELGGIDALVYAPGIGPLTRLADTDAATWRRVFDTNVIGAAIVTSAAIGDLTAAGGTAVYLSSVSASLTPPWPGLGAYAVSKAALDKLVEAWRAEHPHVAFTRVVVGDCAGGEGDAQSQFANNWDTDLAVEMYPIWSARNYLSGSLIDVEHLIAVVDAVLRGGATLSIPSVTVAPRPVTNA